MEDHPYLHFVLCRLGDGDDADALLISLILFLLLVIFPEFRHRLCLPLFFQKVLFRHSLHPLGAEPALVLGRRGDEFHFHAFFLFNLP